jgi:hypothetical protein
LPAQPVFVIIAIICSVFQFYQILTRVIFRSAAAAAPLADIFKRLFFDFQVSGVPFVFHLFLLENFSGQESDKSNYVKNEYNEQNNGNY